jgi:hypothetical protein
LLCTGLLIEKDVDVDLLETWSNAFYPGTLDLPQFFTVLLLDYVVSIFCDVEGCVFVGYVVHIPRP